MKKRDRIAKKMIASRKERRSFYRWARKRWPFVPGREFKKLDAVQRYRLQYRVAIIPIKWVSREELEKIYPSQ